jgi:hypothetical protein
MNRRRARPTPFALGLVIALCGFLSLGLIVRAWQAGDIFSPASGHAQVIAQGVASLPDEVVWSAVFHSIEPGGAVELAPAGAGFVLVDTGGVLVTAEDDATLLAPAEAAFQGGTSPVRLTPLGERPAGVFSLDLITPQAATSGGIPVYTSAPFDVAAGARDIDLVRDLLEPGESTTVIGNETPVLVLVTLGAIRVEATDGSSAELRVGEAATFSGDLVITGAGQAPATFIGAVVGRAAPLAGTPGAAATPAAEPIGSVQATVYACPPLVSARDASPGRCLRDPEAVGLALAEVSGGETRDVGPSTERQGLPTWVGLPAGEYVLQATELAPGFARFFVRGLDGRDGSGGEGYGIGSDGGYLIPINDDAADYALEVYVLGPGGEGAPAGTPSAEAPATPTPEAVATATAAPAGPTEIPSVIQIEGEDDGALVTPTPRATATPRPDPITTATPRPTEQPVVVESTAVARPRRGSVDLRVWGCLNPVETFDPASCSQALDGFDVQLVSEEGEVIPLGEATINDDGAVSWANLPFGTYLVQQPLLLPGAVTYYVPNLPLADDGSGYLVSIDRDNPVATVDIYSLPPSAAPTVAPATADSDADGVLDADETGLFGTDPANPDSDFDGVADGAEIAAGTDPLAGAAPVVEPAADSDGDRLLDGDEGAFGTDLSNPDSDGDGFFDGDEVNLGTNPLDAGSFPTG